MSAQRSPGPPRRPHRPWSTEREDPTPPRFAQAVGGVLAVVGMLGYASGRAALGVVTTGLALVAALLNAAVGFCLGCEMFLLLRRIRLSNN